MSRLGADCRFCGAHVYRDYRRNRYVDDDGASHICPMPELPTIMECACGVIVSALPDGRRYDYRSGQAHQCGVIVRVLVPVVHPALVRSDATPTRNGTASRDLGDALAI